MAVPHPRPLPTILTIAVATTALLLPAKSEYAAPELKSIPLSRLIENIQAGIEKAPDDPELRHHLARVHAMAYVKNLDAGGAVQLNARGKPDQIWFGYEPPHVPYASGSRYDVVPRGKPAPKPPRKNAAALSHLEKAITSYEKALELKPEGDKIIRLGLGWWRMEAGDKDTAIEELRKVIEEAWKEDGKAKFGGLRNFVSAEAIGYLIPLLDPDEQAPEIADLKARKAKLEGLIRPITPIAIPLRDGIGAAAMVDAGARVPFDLDGSGETGRWQWLAAGEAAWLVHDPGRCGRIESGIQMFGNRTFTMFFEHGYDALALLDNDGDGFLRGDELDGLALWDDGDGDGVSSLAEVRPLKTWGIVGLGCVSAVGGEGVRFNPAGVEYEDGSTRPSYDLVLESPGPAADD